MSLSSKYILSFTAASLRLNEMVKVAKAAYGNNATDLKVVKESGVVFSSVKTRTSDREFREVRKRLEKLTPEQISILINGDFISQKQIAFLGVCKRYGFIRDFTIEVIRDKVLVFDFKLNESDFNSFINSKILLHPELEAFSTSTLKKAKQVMYRILEQAGIINNAVEKNILPQIIQQDVINAIVRDDPAWLKIYMMPDKDIKQLRH
jgi:ribosomal protein S8